MASQQLVKNRISSVTNTKQITKAMQLVAASKLRKSQIAAVGPKHYTASLRELLSSIAHNPDIQNHPLFRTTQASTTLTIIISADRGLAGAYGSNIVKAATKHLAESEGHKRVITVGKHISRYIASLQHIASDGAFTMDVGNTELELVLPLKRTVYEAFVQGEVSRVTLIYTEFVSTVSQIVRTETILPVIKTNDAPDLDRIYEPSASMVVSTMVERALEAQLFQAILEARASEHASRMLAMKNATDNATELIDDLTLLYNNVRQSKITQELAEISAGAEAIT